MALRNSEYQLGLTNLNESRVVDVVLEFVEHEELSCACDECILDIAALALNRTRVGWMEQFPPSRRLRLGCGSSVKLAIGKRRLNWCSS